MPVIATPPDWDEDGTLTLSGNIFADRTLTVLTDNGSGDTEVNDGLSVLFTDSDRPNTIIATSLVADTIDLSKFQVVIAVNDNPDPGDNMTFFGSAALRNHLFGGSGADMLTGGGQADRLDGRSNDDTLNGAGGDDTLIGGLGSDIINGGADNDTVTYTIGEGADTVDGGAGNDFLNIVGSALNDSLTVVASGGLLTSVAGGTVTNVENVTANALDGITDLLSYGATTQDITVNLATSAATGFITITGFEYVTGGSGNDTLTGDTLHNFLIGAGGDDTINGGDQNDTLFGGAGNDIIIGGPGIDVVVYFIGEGSDTVDGGADIDVLNILGSDLNDSLTVVASGGILTSVAGGTVTNVEFVTANALGGITDLLSYGATTQDIAVNLSTAEATGFSPLVGVPAIDGFENVTGGSGDDTLTGDAQANVLNGAGGDDIINGGAGIDTMSGGADNDSYFVDAAGDVVNEAAGQGSDRVIAVASYALAAGASIELLQTEGSTSTAVINLTGNELAQTLQGNAAANTLDGGGAADTMQGFAGNDTYFVDNAGDNIIDTAGIDNVKASVAYMLAAGVSVETLQTISAAGTTAINLTGNNLSNTVIGNAGNNILDGGSNSDTLQGLGGNDAYFVDDAGDNIIDTAGIDNVNASVSYTLAAGVAVETLRTTNAAGTIAINLTGNNLSNTVIGNAGNNILSGAAGVDLLQGGLGNDIYVVDNVADKAIEAAGAGTDRVDSAVTFTIGANVENLTLTGAVAINGAGNTLANILIGNGANNTLSGGAGVDSLRGGLGNDSYIVDHVSDQVVESAGAGTDRIVSSVAEVLALNVENLTLTGAAAINGTGNALNNTIKGNNAVNTLNGLAGSDIMQGLGGNDTYVVDRTTDRVIEAASGGLDLVKSSATFALAVNVDNLTLTGAGAIRGTGNATANTINGNNAANVLAGMTGNDTLNAGGGNDLLIGGLGKDLMIGGLGNDRFDFNTVAEIGKGITRDVIVGFTHLTDKIDLGTIDANGAAGGHTFTFLTAVDAAFTGVAGQLRWFRDDLPGSANDRTIIEGDINGNKAPDFQIQLAGLKLLTAADFVL